MVDVASGDVAIVVEFDAVPHLAGFVKAMEDTAEVCRMAANNAGEDVSIAEWNETAARIDREHGTDNSEYLDLP